MFEIIKNAPPPTPKLTRGTYNFAAMEVGDAFDAPRDLGKTKTGLDNRQNTVGASARNWAKKNNPSAKFTVRLRDADTVRCHRIA